MITLFFLVCLSIHPDTGCHQMSIASYESDMRCRLARNQSADAWQKKHPEQVLVKAWCGEK